MSRMANDHRPLAGAALVKEVCRRIRVARSYWDAHNNRACRGEREKAIALYETLSAAEREKVPQALRVWLRYRSEGLRRRANSTEEPGEQCIASPDCSLA